MQQPNFSGERLTLARQRRGLKKNQLAALVGVKVPTISAYERDDREPPDDTRLALASALEFPVEFFLDPGVDPVPLSAVSFRSLSRMRASQRDAALASGTLCVELSRWMDERFHLPEMNVPSADLRFTDPAGAATLVRSAWGLGTAPIGNVLQTLEANGVRIFALGLEYRAVDAFSFWRDETPYVLVGTHKSPERQVFDLAHELGHLVMHHHEGEPRGREEEREADAFASSFLMPREDLIECAPRVPAYPDLVRAKKRWKVSVAALGYRMHQEQLMTDWAYHRLCMHLSRQGRDREPEPLPREQSQVLTKVLAALRKAGVSRREIAADLRLFPPDVDALLGELTLSVVGTSSTSTSETTSQRRPLLRLVE